MVKALINGKTVSLDNGIWSCDDIVLLDTIRLFVKASHFEVHHYHPQPELQLMEWVCEKTGGEIIFVDGPDPVDLDAEY